MSRFIFATVPLAGHTLPAIPIARALVDRGHSVRWYSGAAFAERITTTGATYVPMSNYDYSVNGLDAFYPDRLQHAGLRRLQFDMVAGFTRPVPTHISDLQALMTQEPADVLVGDVAIVAGPILQELGGPPFAAFGITVLAFPDPDLAPFGLGLVPSVGVLGRFRNRLLNGAVRSFVFRPMFDAVNQIRHDLGLPAVDDLGMGYPAHAELFLQLSTPSFEYPRSELPSALRYVGPGRPPVQADWDEPGWWRELTTTDKPVVLVTQGTVANDPAELIRPALHGLAGEDVMVVAVTGGPDPADLGRVPDNARVERFLPFDQLLPHVDVFVTNGGFGGVQLALSHGVPIVAAGKTEDKAEVAARVAYAGVGINLKTQQPKATEVTAAVREVLGDVGFSTAARRIQAEIEASGREDQAADLLEQLAIEHTTARVGGAR